MENIHLHTSVVQAQGLLAGDIDDEVVLLELNSDKYFGMDPVGARIWKLLSQPQTISAVCDRLQEEYDVDRQTCEQDVLAFVKRLADANLVEIVSE